MNNIIGIIHASVINIKVTSFDGKWHENINSSVSCNRTSKKQTEKPTI